MKLYLNEPTPAIAGSIMPLIVNLPVFAEELQNAFSEISADIASFKNNPQCSCARKVQSFIEQHYDSVFNFLNNFFDKNTSLQQTINSIIEGSSFYDVSGKIFEINDTAEAYTDFFNRTIQDRFNFRGFSVTSKGDKLRIFFL
jgi:hypothetical protein